jgi:uncharacterized membrane protein YedE/YeeE
MFDTPDKLALGLVTGVMFGFLLHKGRVTKFGTIVGQFLLKDFTVLKVMLTAVVVGGIGVYALLGLDLATLHVKPLVLGGVILGGLIFGVGMTLLGYCPGTGVAAVGEGSRHAIVGVFGMLVGAAVYAEVAPLMKATVLQVGDFGKITLADATGLSPWVFLTALAIGATLLFVALERWQRGRLLPQKAACKQPGDSTAMSAS